MVRRESIERSENRCGGRGVVTVHKLLDEAALNGHGRGVTWMELPPGASVGLHRHEGASEQFCVLEGSGVFLDGGERVPIRAGEIGLMRPGGSHGIENTGTEPMKVLAVHTYE